MFPLAAAIYPVYVFSNMQPDKRDKYIGVTLGLVIILFLINLYLLWSIKDLKQDIDYIKSDVAEIFYKVLR